MLIKGKEYVEDNFLYMNFENLFSLKLFSYSWNSF